MAFHRHNRQFNSERQTITFKCRHLIIAIDSHAFISADQTMAALSNVFPIVPQGNPQLVLQSLRRWPTCVKFENVGLFSSGHCYSTMPECIAMTQPLQL